MIVQCEGEPTENIRRLSPGETKPGESMEQMVAKQSRLIRLEPSSAREDEIGDLPGASSDIGPKQWSWELSLALPESPMDTPWTENEIEEEYKAAIHLLGDQTEVAIMATPSIYSDLKDDEARQTIYQIMMAEAEDKQDRVVLIDAPLRSDGSFELLPASETVSFLERLRENNASQISQRTAAVYHPGYAWKIH